MLAAAVIFALFIACACANEGMARRIEGPSATSHRGVRRPTAYDSQMPFYSIYSRVSQVLRTRTTFHTRTRTHTPSTRSKTTTRTPPTTPTRPTRNPPVTRYKANDQQPTCDFSLSGYHVITPTSVFISDAQPACEQHGWQYAIIKADDYEAVNYVIDNCTDWAVGIHSYEGHYTGGCQFVEQGGAYLMKLTEEECSAVGVLPILCQDTPQSTTTTTTTTSVEITTTVVAKLNPPVHAAKKARQQPGEWLSGYDVCLYSVNGYHLVYDIFNYTSAEQVCRDLSWYLADIPFDNVGNIYDLFNSCLSEDIMFNIMSYDGLSGGLCNFAIVVPWPSVWMMTSNNPEECSWYYLPVICQEAPNSVTVHSGTYALTTSPTTVVSTVSLATNTVTVTIPMK